jgi:hypothetical protein
MIAVAVDVVLVVEVRAVVDEVRDVVRRYVRICDERGL